MLDFLTSVLAFLFAISVIIFVHEFGHFAVAKAFGMRVLTFSLGFGKQLWGFRRGETEYRVAALPLGGYVKLSGEDETESDDPREFVNRPRWQRIAVYLAGPAMNAVLSVLLIAGLFTVGLEVSTVLSVPAVVGTVETGSPAERAGLAAGDRVLTIDGQSVTRWKDVMFAAATAIDRPLALVVERDGARRELTLTPARSSASELGELGAFPLLLPRIHKVEPGRPAALAGLRAGDEVRAVDGRPLASQDDLIAYVEPRAGQSLTLDVVRGGSVLQVPLTPRADEAGTGKIGVTLSVVQRFPPGQALVESVRFNWDLVRQTLSMIGKIFTGEVQAKSALAGPLQIAQKSGEAARSSFKDLFYLMGVLSISIGLLNLFPIPILDGGQITVLLIESLIRRDLSAPVKERIAQVGLALIVLLMVTVLWFDASKMLTRS
jgi:regulator of sigma E protease